MLSLIKRALSLSRYLWNALVAFGEEVLWFTSWPHLCAFVWSHGFQGESTAWHTFLCATIRATEVQTAWADGCELETQIRSLGLPIAMVVREEQIVGLSAFSV